MLAALKPRMAGAADRLMLLAAAALFSTGGAAVKASTMTSWQLAGFRSLVAAVFLLVFLPACRRRWSLRVLPVAFAYATTLTLYILANRLTTAANATFLQSTAPLYIVALAPLILREKLVRRELIAREYRIIMLVGDDFSDFVPCARSSRYAPCTQAGTHASRAADVLKYEHFWGHGWYILPGPMHGSWTSFR